MRLAWVVLLAGCGFQGRSLPAGDPDAAPGDDAPVFLPDAPAGSTCWKLDGRMKIHLAVCTSAMPGDLHVTQDVEINTDTGVASMADFNCVPLVGTSEPVCAVVATKLTVDAMKRLSAHGAKPLVLYAHDIDLNGAIDVASHAGMRGAGATSQMCNRGDRDATFSGGGGGGGYGTAGADGGDEETHGDSSGSGFNTLGDKFRGGCDGTGGGNGSPEGLPRGAGGLGGGAVWISVDTGTLTIADTAVINASGSGGPGGAIPKFGGGGGGSGGMIVIQAHALVRSMAAIFANGAHGGGGADTTRAGQAGGDPERTSSDGGGGDGAGHTGPPPRSGDGGRGAAGAGGAAVEGEAGELLTGGGGGGGGYGVIWVSAPTRLGTNNVAPNPIDVP